MFDEISLASNLSIKVKSDLVEVLVDLGTHRTSKTTDNALVFMIRGVHSKWKQAVGFYFVRSTAKTYVLKSCIQAVINAIHNS